MTKKQDKIKRLASSVSPGAIKERKYRKAHKRKTEDDDYERLAKNLWNHESTNIVDRVTFEDAYKRYLGKSDLKDDSPFMNKVWKELKGVPGIREEGDELPPVIKPAKDTPRPVYGYSGTVKGKDKHLRITYITWKGKRVVRFRDRLGRFGKVNKKS